LLHLEKEIIQMYLIHGRTSLKVLVSLAFLAALLVLPGSARADEIALWNFNVGGFTANRGTGLLVPPATPATVAFTTDGMSLNAQMGDAPGFSLLIYGGANNINNGMFVDLRVSTVGFNSIMVSFAANRSAGGFSEFTSQFSTDGINFTTTSLGTSAVPEVPPNPTPNMGQVYFDSFSVAAANNPFFTYRIILAGNTDGNNSGIRFDNILVAGTPTAVPEATTLLLLGPGLIGMASAALRRRRKS
jgi:hypothetical protein